MAIRSGQATRPLKVERAYEELKRLIVTLRLTPGTHIDERDLMTRLEIGRTPLREAVLRLTHERLIVHSPRRGAWVSELSITDLQQMLDARLPIEPLVARRAAERVTDADIETLADLLAQASAALEIEDIEELVNVDLQFHSHIAKCSGNVYFAAFSQQINTSMLRYWHVSSQHAQTLPTWLDNHHDLLQAITSGDPDRAAQYAFNHIVVFRERMRNLIV